MIACASQFVTGEMFLAAARTLAGEVQQADLDQGRIYPPLGRIREVSAKIAVAVVEVARRRGLARAEMDGDIPAAIRAMMYNPEYPIYA